MRTTSTIFEAAGEREATFLSCPKLGDHRSVFSLLHELSAPGFVRVGGDFAPVGCPR